MAVFGNLVEATKTSRSVSSSTRIGSYFSIRRPIRLLTKVYFWALRNGSMTKLVKVRKRFALLGIAQLSKILAHGDYVLTDCSSDVRLNTDPKTHAVASESIAPARASNRTGKDPPVEMARSEALWCMQHLLRFPSRCTCNHNDTWDTAQ
jgi:hypothetical protein